MAKKDTAAKREVGGISGDRLRSLVERLERMDEEIKALQEDRKEIFQEANSAGFTAKIIRLVLKIRKMDSEKREEQNTLVATYLRALGDNMAGEDEL